MADKPLNRLFFYLIRTTTKDNGNSNPDPIGYISCRANVARFLDIENKAVGSGADTAPIQRIKKGYERELTLADGTTLAKAEGSDGKVAESFFTYRPSIGSRPVILLTGKETAKGNNRILTLVFPQWADINTISEGLSELIAPGKIQRVGKPSESEIFPFFKLKAGGSYPIMGQGKAQASTKAKIATQSEMEELAGKKGDS
jgi:hypothetical protein